MDRVLFIAGTAIGGSAYSLETLIKGLDRQAFEPEVLFVKQEPSPVPEKLRALNVPVTTLSRLEASQVIEPEQSSARRDIAGWLHKRLGPSVAEIYRTLKGFYDFVRFDLWDVWRVWRAIRHSRPQIVHLNNSVRGNRAEVLATWLTHTPSVCHVRGIETLTGFDRLFLPLVTQFIYISRAAAQPYLEAGVSPARGCVIHNAVDLSELTRSAEQAQRGTSLRSEFGWSRDQKLVGVIGRLDWWKGHEYFLDALAQVRRLVDVHGVIVGAPEGSAENRTYLRRLQQQVKALGLEQHVTFTGFRSDVARWMVTLDVVVLSSSQPEPFGRVLIEAMALGRPVVATAAGGVLEIIEHDRHGLLAPMRDAAALANSIHALLVDETRAQRLGRAARQRVDEKFTLPAHADAVQRIYQNILHPSRARSWAAMSEV